MKRLSFLAVSVLVLGLAAAALAQQKYTERWNYVTASLSSDRGMETLLGVLKQSKDVGCTHIMLVEGGWLRRPDDAAYLGRVEKVRSFARENKLEIVPRVYSLGYSGRYLGFDPNLCAGLPVREMPFVVRGKTASPDPAGNVDVSGVKATDNGMSGKISVKPFTHYRLSFVAAKPFSGGADEWVRVSGRVGGRRVTRRNLDSRKEGDKTFYETTFNSLESEELSVSISQAVEGLKIEPAGLLMVIRRGLCPLVVAGADTGTVYEEGRDFKPVADPKLTTDGEFLFDHEPPVIQLTDGSRIKDGEKLKASFFHAYRMGGDQDVISLEDPKVFEIMEQDVANCTKVWKPNGYFMNYDEIRVGGWEKPDRKPGELLAEHVKRGYDLIRKYAPEAKVYTWSDMFSPYHNARPSGYYFLVNGNWDGSWKGLPKDVIIMNWYSPRPEGLKFFSDSGHSQVICGYYDGTSTARMKNNIAGWMEASGGIPNVLGFMYTTWRDNHRNLKEYFELLDSYGVWGKGGKPAPAKEPGVTE
jgi:hypothetical protein